MYDDDDRSDDPMFEKWAKAVKVRDNFTCQICSRRGVYLESHHLNAWHTFPNERFDLENGSCLCFRCHRNFHDTYGSGENTKWQFEQFKKVAEKFHRMLSSRAGTENSFPHDD